LKGEKKKNNATLAGMKLMERRLLGKKLLNDESAAFPPFQELRYIIGNRTNININSPTHLLEKMLNHTSESSSLDRELKRLNEKLSRLKKDIPILEKKLEHLYAGNSGHTNGLRSRNRSSEFSTISNNEENIKEDVKKIVKNNDNDTVSSSTDSTKKKKKRTVWKQRNDIETVQVEYNSKLKELRTQMSVTLL
jgi:hypothetical protein